MRWSDLVDLARRQDDAPPRRLIGLCGPPGVGKSTLAQRLVQELGVNAVLLGMDGFHLANSTLDRLGLRDVKGAPETFDVHGFVALLERVRNPAAGETIYAPAYDRSISAGVTGVLEIRTDHNVVIVEGNYLLMGGAWQGVRERLDHTVYLELDETVRLQRLIDRHIQFGRSYEDALEWVHRSDEANARLIEATKRDADEILALNDTSL